MSQASRIRRVNLKSGAATVPPLLHPIATPPDTISSIIDGCVFRYSPNSGQVWRFIERSGAIAVRRPHWRETGLSGTMGYATIRVGSRKILAHRLIWRICTGEWPPLDIDHVDGNRRNNRLANLRVVDRSANMKNARRPSDNKSGAVGVCWNLKRKKWAAQIGSGGRVFFLGYFDSFHDAIAARKAAQKQYDFHSNHGRQ